MPGVQAAGTNEKNVFDEPVAHASVTANEDDSNALKPKDDEEEGVESISTVELFQCEESVHTDNPGIQLNITETGNPQARSRASKQTANSLNLSSDTSTPGATFIQMRGTPRGLDDDTSSQRNAVRNQYQEAFKVSKAFLVDEEEERAYKEKRYEELMEEHKTKVLHETSVEATNVVVTTNRSTVESSTQKKVVVLLSLTTLVTGVLIVAFVPDYGDRDDEMTNRELLEELLYPLSGSDLFNETSPRFQAIQWLINEDPLQLQVNVHDSVIIKERYIVSLLYFCTSGPSHWLSKSNFLSNTSVCDWKGSGPNVFVSCTNGNVDRLVVQKNGMHGTIPREISGLMFLKTFSLAENQLYGSLPESLGSLRRLENVELVRNKLTGTLPNTLANITRLQYFNVFGNKLTGTIPSGLFKIQSVEYMNLIRNALTGTIPDFGSGQSRWTFLGIAFNRLHGRVPYSITALSSMEILVLDNNQLTGPLPATENWREMQFLQARHNMLTGTIPTEYGAMDRLRIFDIAANLLTGTIPTEMGRMYNVEFLNLGVNQLSGNIPEELSQLNDLRDFVVAVNNLSGSIPSALLDLPIDRLDVGINNYTGSLEGFCLGMDGSSIISSFTADCGGMEPKVVCPCCTVCCADTYESCSPQLKGICDNRKQRLEWEGKDRGTQCTCSDTGDRLSCVDTSCKYCNGEESICFIDDAANGGYGIGLRPSGVVSDWIVSVEYVSGFNENINVYFNYSQTANSCQVSINDEECAACKFTSCPGDGYNTLAVDCSNLGYSEVNGCRLMDPGHPLAPVWPEFEAIFSTYSFAPRYDCLPLNM